MNPRPPTRSMILLFAAMTIAVLALAALVLPKMDATQTDQASSSLPVQGGAELITGRSTTSSHHFSDPPPADPPAYQSVLLTVYGIYDASDYSVWCKDCSPTIGSLAACRLLGKGGGGYESGKCNGHIRINGKYYYQSQLRPTEQETLLLPGKDKPTINGNLIPVRQLTLATPQTGPCAVPRGSAVYLKLPDVDNQPNPWSGWYLAQDVGSAITDCHFDVYGGEGSAPIAEAIHYVSHQHAQAWVCKPDGSDCKAVGAQVQSNLGTYDILPHFTTQYRYDLSVYDALGAFAKDAIAGCTDDPAACLAGKITVYNTAHPTTPLFTGSDLATQCDAGDYAGFKTFAENIADCMENNQSDCLCDASVGNGIGHKEIIEAVASLYYTLNTTTDGRTTLALRDEADPSKPISPLPAISLPGTFITYTNASTAENDTWNQAAESHSLVFKGFYGLASDNTPTGRDVLTGGLITLVGVESPSKFMQRASEELSPTTAGWITLSPLPSVRLQFYKQDTQNISLVAPGSADKPMCKPRKTDFRLCSIPQDLLPVYVPQPAVARIGVKNTLQQQKVPIRFAIQLKDDAPEPILEAMVSALAYSDEAGQRLINVTFHSSSSTDIDHYAIHCKDATFDDPHAPAEAPAAVFTPVAGSSEPFLAQLTSCSSAGSQTPVPLDPDTDYSVMVVPVDRSGQTPAENPSVQARKM